MNKEQLEKSSDDELSAKLTIAVIKSTHSEFKSIEYDEAQKCVWVERAGFSSYPLLDINNPSDMMPLAFEAGISLVNDNEDGGYYAHPPTSHYAAGGESGRFDYECNYAIGHKNPCRAAAIVWLLMQEG